MHVRFVVFRKIDSIITRTRAFDIFNKLIIVLSKEIWVDSPSIGWISYTIFIIEWMYRYGQQIEIIRPVLVFISFSFFSFFLFFFFFVPSCRRKSRIRNILHERVFANITTIEIKQFIADSSSTFILPSNSSVFSLFIFFAFLLFFHFFFF